jgi:hypothetical protein
LRRKSHEDTQRDNDYAYQNANEALFATGAGFARVSDETPEPTRWQTLVELAAWVDSRIEAEVTHRPDVNIHKRTLADTWGQMQCKLQNMLTGSEALGAPAVIAVETSGDLSIVRAARAYVRQWKIDPNSDMLDVWSDLFNAVENSPVETSPRHLTDAERAAMNRAADASVRVVGGGYEKATAHHPRCELMQPHSHEPQKCTCSGLKPTCAHRWEVSPYTDTRDKCAKCGEERLR